MYALPFSPLAEKYCSLVETEGGLTLLQDILAHSEPPTTVKDLATMVLENCRVQSDPASWCFDLDG